MQHTYRTHQIRPLRASRILAMATGAILFIDRFALLRRRRIRRRTQPKKIPYIAASSSATSAATPASATCLIGFLRGQQAPHC